MNDPDDPARLFALGAWSAQGRWEAPPPESLHIPGLRILSFAGRGGMGAVYRAVQTSLDRPVAVKVLPPASHGDDLNRERFVREARILGALEHPHILRIIEFGETAAGNLFLVMEWAAGGDLRERLKQGRPSVAEAADWIAQIAGGLDFAHHAGVIHRDLKPGNLLLDRHGQIKIGDFGLARAAGPGFTTALTLSGTTLGTLDYMAPEQFVPGGHATVQTDIYALGVLAYELLTGKLPKGSFPRASSLARAPRAVDAVLARALSQDPGKRYLSAGAFSRAFSSALRRRKPGVLIGALVLVGVAVASLSSLFFFKERRNRDASPRLVKEVPLPVPPSPSPVPSLSPSVDPSIGPSSAPSPPLATPAPQPGAASATTWVSVLPQVQIDRDTRAGQWQRTAQGIATNTERCVLSLPVEAGENYDIRLKFTRMSGRHSVVVFLPTRSGPATLELDAWEQHLGGVQDIDGRDMRASGSAFPAELTNGAPQELLIQVRDREIRCDWNGLVKSWPITGRRLSINPLWQTSAPALPGIGSWESPALFHSVEFRNKAD